MTSDHFQVDEKALKQLSAAEQREIRDALAGIQDALKRNPLYAYVPYEKQRAFHGSGARTRMFVGGNRAGKTTTGAADDLIQALPPELVPPHLMPYKKFGHSEPFKGRVITPDLTRTMDAVVTKFREMIPKEALFKGEWGKAFDKTRRILRFDHGSTVDFMSTDQDVDKFGGVDLHRVHWDEEPSGIGIEHIWQESRWRLLDHGGDMILTMTPLFGVSTLVHDRVWEPFQKQKPGIFAIQASVWDNPHISRAEIQEAIEDMTKEEVEARVHGQFVHFGGRFYDEFDKDTHVRKPMAPADLQGLDVVVGIDPGLERTAVVWVAFDADNAAVVFTELYMHDELPQNVANAIKRKNFDWGIDPLYYVIDPSARVRSQVSREQVESAYQREGIATVHGQNDRKVGILEVKRRLQAKPPSLTVTEDCTNLIWEFPRYRRDTKSQDEWAAIKQDDHLLDALRYVCMERPWGPYGAPSTDENWSWTPGTAPNWRELEGAGAGPNPPLGAMS